MDTFIDKSIPISRFLTYYEENEKGDCVLGILFLADKNLTKFQYYSPITLTDNSNEVEFYVDTLLYCINPEKDFSKIYSNKKGINCFTNSRKILSEKMVNYISNKLGVHKIIVPIDINSDSFYTDTNIFFTYIKLNIYDNSFDLNDKFIDVKRNKLYNIKETIFDKILHENKEDFIEDILKQAENYSILYNMNTINKNNQIVWI